MCTNAKQYICFPVHVTGIATTEKNARSAKKERKCRYPLSTFLQQSVPIPAFRNDFPQQETKSGPKKASTKKHKLESPQPKKSGRQKNKEKTRTNAATFCSFPASMFSISEIHTKVPKCRKGNICHKMFHNVPKCRTMFQHVTNRFFFFFESDQEKNSKK